MRTSRRLFFGMMALMMVLSFAASANATAFKWKNAVDGDWNSISSWDNGTAIPGSGDLVTFDNATAPYTVTSTAATMNIGTGGFNVLCGTPTFDFHGKSITTGSILIGYNAAYNNINAYWTGGTWTLTSAYNLCVGFPGTGDHFEMSNDAGTCVLTSTSSAAYIGRTSGAVAANSNSLTIRNGASVTIAGTSTGVLDIGIANTAGGVADNNTVTVTGPGSTLTARLIYVGYVGLTTAVEATGNALVVDNGGTATSTYYSYVGYRSVANPSTCTGNSITVGGTGTGATFNANGYGLFIGPYAGNNTVTVNKGGIVNAVSTTIYNFPGNTIKINGGTFNAKNAMTDNNTEIFIVGDNIDNATPAVYHMVGGTHKFMGGMRVQAADGWLAGYGTLNAYGAGVLINGVLSPDNGTLAPGNTGTFTFSDNGTITLGPSSNLIFDMGATYDKLVATTATSADNLTLDGTLTVNILPGVAGGTYTLITAGNISGAFANVVFTNMPVGCVGTYNIDNTTVKITLPDNISMTRPVFSPAGGGFSSSPQTVTITSVSPGARIYYTLDGSAPDNNTGTFYTGAFDIGSATLIKAIAYPPVGSGSFVSPVATALFEFPTDSLNRPTNIPYGTAIVDGDLSDWAGATWAPLDVVYAGSPTDIAEAYYAARWTPNKIYVAVKVRDTTHVFTNAYSATNASDAIQVFLHTSGYRSDYMYPSQVEAQYYVLGIRDDNRTAVWKDLGNNNAVPSVCHFLTAGKEGVDGQWLYYEAALTPFTYMAGLAGGTSVASPVVSGQIIGLDVVAVGNNGVYTGMKSENNMLNKSSLYTTMGLHLLAGTAPQPGDVNNDEHVNAVDLTIVMAAMDRWDTDPTFDPRADIDNDYEVTSADLSIVLANME